MQTGNQGIETYQHETRTFPPPPVFAAKVTGGVKVDNFLENVGR